MLDSNFHRYDPAVCEFSPSSGGATRTRHETPQSKLIAAASRGDLEAIGRTLSEPAPRLDLDHPLRLAAKHRHGAAVRLLIGRGASVSRAFSANHAPSRLGKREQLVQFLSSCGIDAQFIGARKDTRDPSGEEPSRKAACASHPRRCARSGAGRPEGVLGPCATAQRSASRAHFRMSFGNVSCAAGAGPIK